MIHAGHPTPPPFATRLRALFAAADIQEGVLRSLSGLLDAPACLPVFERNADAAAQLVPLLLRAYRGVEHESWQGLVEVLLRWVGCAPVGGGIGGRRACCVHTLLTDRGEQGTLLQC